MPLTPEERADRDMSEVPTLTDLVVGELKRRGWLFLRLRQGRPGWALGSGFPDLFALRGEEHAFIELKREGQELDPKQVEWRDAVLAAGFRHYVFRPSDWRLGRVQELLDRSDRADPSASFRPRPALRSDC